MTARKRWRVVEAPAPWALVVVYEYPSKTRPIIVNVYEYPERKDALTEQRRVKEEVKTAHNGQGRLIACRVRPIHRMEESAFR
jgi:hypothetical protein